MSCWSPAQPQTCLSLSIDPTGWDSWAAEWLPGLTSDLLCHCGHAQSSMTVSDPDYVHQTSSWSSSSSSPWAGNWFFQLDLRPASGMFDELDSWLTTAATHEHALLPHSGAALPGWNPGSYRAASSYHALTVKPSSLCLGSSWMVTVVHNLWCPSYSLLRKPQGQAELYHTAVAPYLSRGAFFTSRIWYSWPDTQILPVPHSCLYSFLHFMVGHHLLTCCTCITPCTPAVPFLLVPHAAT